MNRRFITSRIPRLSALVLPLAVLFSTLMIGSASADTSVCAQAFGSFSATNFPTACWRPYSSSSPFNRLLPTNPTIAPNSASIIANLTANNVNFEGGGPFAFTSDDGRDGIYYSRTTDPVVTIHCTYYWGPGTCTGANKVNIDGQQIRIPAGAMPQDNGTDMHMTVFDQADNLEYDFEHATWSSDRKTLNVWAGAEIVAGPDLGTGLGAGGTAAGTATPAGLITAPELASGTINHALAINLPCTNGSVYPAGGPYGLACSQMQGENTAGAAPLGTLLQLNMTDAQIAASGAPAWEKTIMTAMAHYGMYVNDTDGMNEIELEAESDISYTSLGGQPLMANFISQQGGWYYSPLNRWIMEGPGIPIGKLRVVDPCWAQSLCTGSNTSSSSTSGSTSSGSTSTTPTATNPPPVSTPPTTTPVSTTSPATTPVTPTPAPTPVASAPASPKQSPAPSKHAPKKKQAKTRRRSSIAHTASVDARACRASKSRAGNNGAKRAACTSAVIAAKRRAAARR
jgi:cell division septation protein DedD